MLTITDDGIQTIEYKVNEVANVISAVAIQNDGKIVITGLRYDQEAGININYFLIRYNTDGSIDNTFIAQTSVETPRSLAIQKDNKIIVAAGPPGSGGTTSHITRFNTNGTRDRTFGTNGSAT